MLIAVAVENDRALAGLRFEAIRVKLCLLLSHARVALGPLGFDDAQRLAVVAPEHVVNKAVAGIVRHTPDRVFRVVARLGEGPPRFVEQKVDEGVAGRRFVIVVRIGDFRVRCFDRRDLRPQAGDLLFELCALGLGGEALGLRVVAGLNGLREAPGDFLQLTEVGDRNGRGARQCLDGECQARVGARPAAVRASEPVGEMEQFAKRGGGLRERHGFGVVDCAVAEVLDDPRLGDQWLSDQLLERRLVNMRRQCRLERVLQTPVMAIDPLNDDFQGEAGVEARSAGVGMGEAFCPGGMFMRFGEVAEQESKLRHGPPSAAVRDDRINLVRKVWRKAR